MRPIKFWDCEYQDTTDLAVMVAGDVCEGRIDPAKYLRYQNDLRYLSLYRLALLAGCKDKDIMYLSETALDNKLHEVVCNDIYEHPDMSNRHYMAALRMLVYPFARWGSNILWAEYSSLTPADYEREDIQEILKDTLGFNVFAPYMVIGRRVISLKNIFVEP